MNITRGVIKKAQKIVLYAPEGVGKTTFASQFPDPLFMDTEEGSTHIDVARLDKPTSMPMVGQQLEFVKNNKPCKTLVIDTVDWLEMLVTKHVCDLSGVDSIEKAAGSYGKGYTEVAENMGRLLDRLSDIINVGIHVVLLCHTEVKRHEDPLELGSYDRYTLKLGKKVAPMVKEWADMVLFAMHDINVVNIDGKGETKGKNKATGNGNRKMFTQFSPSFDAKNRHGLPKELPFEFASIKDHISDSLIDNPVVVKTDIVPTTQVTQPVASTPIVETESVVGIKQEDFSALGGDKPYDQDLTGIPKALADLMVANKVYLSEIQTVIENKGIYSKGTPFSAYSEEIIQGLLISGWDQLYEFVIQERMPF